MRTFGVEAASIEAVAAAKGGRTVSLCIPCRNEVATIGPLVRTVRAELMGDRRWSTSCSCSTTAAPTTPRVVAADAGATVVPIDDVHRVHGVGHGKGNALWATLAASSGDVRRVVRRRRHELPCRPGWRGWSRRSSSTTTWRW